MSRASLAAGILALSIPLAGNGAPAEPAGSLALADGFLHGRILDSEGNPIPGAMLSVASPAPVHRITVYSAEDGSYRTPEIPFARPYTLRVRRVGWKDLRLEGFEPAAGLNDFRLARDSNLIMAWVEVA